MWRGTRRLQCTAGALPFKGSAVTKLLPYLASKALSEKEVAGFVENKEWLEKLIQGFELREPSSSTPADSKLTGTTGTTAEGKGSDAVCSPGVEEEKKGKIIPAQPFVFMYGSAVAGTAFLSGDVDFALGFRKLKAGGDNTSSESCEFVEIDREQQPEVLGQVYEHLHKQTGDSVRFQRIFRARIPILQYVPVLSDDQLGNASSSSLEFAAGSGSPVGGPKKEASSPPPLTFTPKSGGRFGQAAFVSSLTQKKDLEGNPIYSDESSSKSNSMLTPQPKDIGQEKTPEGNTKTSENATDSNTQQQQARKKLQGIDISLGLDGYRNSLLIRSYIQANPLLGPLIMCLKHWGRHAGILNARRGWLSPYALSILAIHYAHNTKLIAGASGADEMGGSSNSCTPVELIPVDTMDEMLGKVIAPLDLSHASSILAPSSSSSSSSSSADPLFPVASLTNEGFLKSYEEQESGRARSSTGFGGSHGEQLERALQGFFDYYDKEFDFDTQVVDIRQYSEGRGDAAIAPDATDSTTTAAVEGEKKSSYKNKKENFKGRITTKDDWHKKLLEGMSDKDKWHRLGHGIMLIRDPFEAHSLGRSVDFFHAEGIRETFRQCRRHEGFYLKGSTSSSSTGSHNKWENLFVH